MRNKIFSSVVAAAWMLMTSRAAFALPAQEPLFLVSQVSPMVMFAMSVDHQLFTKAFADYSDLNGDGTIDNTYTDTFDYYGYFDSKRCYRFNSSGNYFEPRNAASGANSHHCANSSSSGDWSGNFLNWATMTRIDVLRKALYGGKRSTDSTSRTVLERELLPNDVHAFVKVFTAPSGDSMANYTPYSNSTISLCNVTPPPTSGADQTQNMNTPSVHRPKVMIASGSWPSWSAGEVYQCVFDGDDAGGNPAGTFPPKGNDLTGNGGSQYGGISVRVEVCVANKEESNCKTYNTSTVAKPTGLLQDYGEDRSLRFGLTSGSYQKRDKGGVLRKGISYLAGNTTASDDEIDLSDGTFNTSVNGIISTLNKVRLNTWDYSQHKYTDCDTYGITVNDYLTSTSSGRRCSNWGNPLSEIYLEAVRYLAGEGSPTSTFNVSSDSLGLPTASWSASSDPMPVDEWCTPMNVVVIASGDNDFDTDHLGTAPSELGTLSTAIDAVGAAEGFSGGVFIGEVGSSPETNPDDNSCSVKTFTSLSQMRGLCPSTPARQGGYGLAGIAYKAHIEDLRSDRQNDPSTGEGQTINTFALALAKSLPDFVFDIGGNKVTIVPNGYAYFGSGSWRASSLAGVTVEETNYANGKLTYIRFLAHWEDSAWGNDYDMDVISRISACVGVECTQHDDDGNGSNDSNPGNGVLRVTPRAPLAASGAAMRVGVVVSGTTADGEYTTLQKNSGVSYNSLVSTYGYGATRHPSEPNPSSHIKVFTPGTSTAKFLPSPLQLAAKYGSFNESDNFSDDGDATNDNNDPLPDVASEWDEDGDGVADSFFFADDPSQIGPKLAAYLSTIATTSSSASVVANSVSLQTQTRLFQARFDSTDWSGSVVALQIDPATGQLRTNPNDANEYLTDWDVADQVDLQDHDTGREWMTWNSDLDGSGEVIGGVPFRWASLNSTQQTALNLNPGSGTSDSRGSQRLDWLRGDQSNEQSESSGAQIFRDREETVLGDVVNSTPIVVGTPSFGYSDALESVAYSSFKATYADVECFTYDSSGNATPRSVSALDREPILYFGGNDGALHGVSACTGDERLAYVPSAVYPTLNQLTSPNYQHKYYVDGPVTVVDAFFDGAWHSVLIGSQGAGGSGIFALDVTDPSKFDETYAGDVVLWDIQATPTAAGSAFEKLGYGFSRPIVVKANGYSDWVAIFGNGYDGKDGKAILYVVRVKDGTLLDTIDLSATGPGAGAHGASNGLSSVSAVDRDGDGDADLLYAGDLNGNLWRFAATSSGFSRSETTLLYTAKNASGSTQRLTARVGIGLHPTSAIGRVIYFGTGKYYELTDQDPANAVVHNTMYGIWDRDDGQTISTVTTRNSNVFQKQTIDLVSLESFGDNDETIRLVSNTPIQWASDNSATAAGACAANQSCGWYIDLIGTGEKSVNAPILRGGRLIFVTTMPSPVACDEGGSGWLMELDPYTGGRLDVPVLDLNGDGVFDAQDSHTGVDDEGNTVTTPPSGVLIDGIVQNPLILDGFGRDSSNGDKEFQTKNFSTSKQARIDVKVESPDAGGVGRKSWVRIK